MPLNAYHKKRNFTVTREPRGQVKKTSQTLQFVVQKHAASHLHYDFRLEWNGVLLSWAVPKGPSLDPAVKRLAVHVEDHPVEYGSFEGIIPAGEYGGGNVIVWDNGTWKCDIDPQQAYDKGHIAFTLKGKKLKGHWQLVQIKKDPKNWLLIKSADRYAKEEADYSIIDAKPKSVISRKTVEAIGKAPLKKKPSTTLTKKIVLPPKIHPELATLVAKPPAGDEWLHEIKLDGYRLLAFIEQNKVRLITRNQLDWTHKFPALAQRLNKLKLGNAILDGELVALDKNQHSNFQILQNSIHDADTSKLVYFVFDLLYYQFYDLRPLSLVERKTLLQAILTTDDYIRFSDHIIGQGEKLLAKARKLGLEGIVSKRTNSPYRETRTLDWQKSKCNERQEFAIVGYTAPKGNRQQFGSLLLAVKKGKEWVYCGHVGTGFNEASLREVGKKIRALKKDESVFKPIPKGLGKVTWIEPKLVAEVEFTHWTDEGILRHPSFKGLRRDKKSKDIIKEEPPMTELTNPSRVLYPDANITKADLIHYYELVSDWILPHIKNRPLAIVRAPRGWHEQQFFQKHLAESHPAHLFSGEDNEPFLYLKGLEGLLELVQLATLEIHPWGCHVDKLEKPDLITFDIDPSPEIAWKTVVETAFLLRAELEKIGLESFVKTTGGKGLHVVFPIVRRHDWDTIKIFTHTFVDYIVTLNPALYISTMNKAKRKGKIFLDYLRNQRSATAIAPYSTRARANATVATPLSWDELTTRLNPAAFTIKTLPRRLEHLKDDPWESFYKIKQSLKLP